MRIRSATPVDAEEVARVHHTSWVETYSHLLPDDYFETDTVERRTERLRDALDRGVEVTIAETDPSGHHSEIVGLALVRPSRPHGGYGPVRDKNLNMLYVLAGHHGTGVGQMLLDAVLPRGEPAQLWVAEENPRARRFYERNGFITDGARFVDDECGGIVEIRMVR